MIENVDNGHHPLNCPSSSAEYWRSAMRGEHGLMAQDRAETVNTDSYKFCKSCDPNLPQKIKTEEARIQTQLKVDEKESGSVKNIIAPELTHFEGDETEQKHAINPFHESINNDDFITKAEKSKQDYPNVPDEEFPWDTFLSNLAPQSSKPPLIIDKKETLQQIYKSLTLSLNTLRKNPQELASQLTGHLLDSKNFGVQEFLSSLEEKVNHIWLRPRRACLPGPESPIIYSWPVLNEVPACRLIVSENGEYVASVSNNQRWIWEIETGQILTPVESEQLFLGVDWSLWRENLPDHQFSDSGIEKWSMETPSGSITVACILDPPRHAFHRSYSNSINCNENGEISNLYKNSYSMNFASEGFLAPALLRSRDKVICGGLGGIISIWDLASRTLESTMTIGNRTIVAIVGMPDLMRCAALTLDGQLLIVETNGNSEKINNYLSPPKNLFISMDYSIAITTHMDSSILIWCTNFNSSVLRKPNTSGPFEGFLLTPDLSFAIITGHGDDDYDGWLLTGINLTTGVEVFHFETRKSSEMFGSLFLEIHDNRKYLRIDPLDLKSAPSDASTSYNDVSLWVSLTSGDVTKGKPPTLNGKKIEWANREMYKVITGKLSSNPNYVKKFVNLEFARKINLRSNSRSILLTPDLSLAIVSGLGEDKYDGWLLTGVNLETGFKVFSLETRMPSDMFGPLSLEIHDNQKYLRIDPLDLKSAPRGASTSYTDVALWVSLTSGDVTKDKPPTLNGKKIEWAKKEMYKEKSNAYGSNPGDVNKDTNLELVGGISVKSDYRSIQITRSDALLAQFTVDEDIHFLGVSPVDDTVIYVTRAGLFTLEIVGIK